MKVNADDGQGYLKVLLQIVFQVNYPAGMVDSDMSPNRTFLLALLPGVKESHKSVREAFKWIKWAGFFDLCRAHEIPVWVSVDMKMENLMLGIGPCSSTYGLSRSKWAKRLDRCQQHEARTMKGIVEEAARRKAGEH